MPLIQLVEFQGLHGRCTDLELEVTQAVRFNYDRVKNCGLTVTVEYVGFFAFYSIFDPVRGDYLLARAKRTPPETVVLFDLLRDFKSDQYRDWADHWDRTEKNRTKPRASREALRAKGCA